MKKLSHFSLFTGIGGIDVAAERAGFETVGQCEINPFSRQILEKRFGVPIIDDIRKITKERTDEILLKKYDKAVELYNSGLSVQKVADYFGVTRQAMWVVLKRRTTLRSNLKYGEENHFYRGGKTEDDHAQNMTEYAIRKDLIQKKDKCEACGDAGNFKDGRTKIQAHHCDYNKPLEVMWLCQRCHHEWHKTHIAIKKEVMPSEVPDTIDLVSGGFPR